MHFHVPEGAQRQSQLDFDLEITANCLFVFLVRRSKEAYDGRIPRAFERLPLHNLLRHSQRGGGL